MKGDVLDKHVAIKERVAKHHVVQRNSVGANGRGNVIHDPKTTRGRLDVVVRHHVFGMLLLGADVHHGLFGAEVPHLLKLLAEAH